MTRQRDIVKQISGSLDREEIFLLIGPRQVGKTIALHQIENQLKQKGQPNYFLNLEDPDYLQLLNQSPKNLFQIFPFDLKQKTYLLVDEVQYLDNPSGFLKFFFDQYQNKIKIIASGSSAFYLDKKFKDSLAGRKRIFTLLSLSFREFLKFKEEPKLAAADFLKLTLSEKEKIQILFGEYLLYGGYPKVVLSPMEEKRPVLSDLAYSYIKKDIFEANIRQEKIFFRLLKILASQVGNLVNSSELSQTLGISKTAIDNYLYVMQKSFHITLIKPFFKNIRKELTKMPKAYFWDLGLRNFFKNDFRPFYERDDRGQLLENAAFKQLSERYNPDEIHFWRTADQKEIDFVIEQNKIAFEVKSKVGDRQKRLAQLFNKNYPDIKLKLIELNNVWQI